MENKTLMLTKTYKNTETGEYTTKNVFFDNYYTRKDGYLFGSKRTCFRTFKGFDYPEDITYADRGRIDKLKMYVREKQYLFYRSGNDKLFVDSNQLERILELSHNRALSFIKKMKKYGILKELSVVDETRYMLSPLLGLYGKRIHPDTYYVFRKELRLELPANVVADYEMDSCWDRNIKVV